MAQPELVADAGEAPPIATKAADLLDMQLEDLLTLESTSVAKKRQKVADSAAAVFVITQEDIRRSSASTIPDLLRGVPGVEVGHQATGGYAVSIRGFNSRLANSLLVMIDGRSQFISSLSGVFWDQMQLPLGDIERIEVIRGPGAALWGANSSNGVINIITKHSADSGGLQVDARGGARLQTASASYGARLADNLTMRAYGSYRREQGMVDASGADMSRRWLGGSGGLRADYEPDDANAYTVQAEAGGGRYDIPFGLPSADLLHPGLVPVRFNNSFTSYNVLGRWTHKRGTDLDWTLQGQYSYVMRNEFDPLVLKWQQADIDFGLHWKPGRVHDINVGLGARLLHDKINGLRYLYFPDASATDRWISGYIQDDIAIVPDKVRLTLGTKLEHNNFTGFEIQPNARLFVRPSRDLALWGAVTRAVRTPSRLERSAFIAMTVDLPGSSSNPYPLPIYGTLNGVPGRQSERLTAFEAGARLSLARGWSLDLAGYYNRYADMTVPTPTSVVPLFMPPVPYPLGLQVNLAMAGRGQVRTWGGEAVLSGTLAPWWKVDLRYSRFANKVADDPLTGKPAGLFFPIEGSPAHQASLTSKADFGDRVSLDGQLRHVSSISNGSVPAYTELDLRLSHRTGTLELSLVGNNLLHARHMEFWQPLYPAPMAYEPRTVTAQIRYRF